MTQLRMDHSILSQAANKTVIITGAARGIGAATATLFNRHGANVVIADLDQFREGAENLISGSFAYPNRGLFVPGNIVDWAELTTCFETAMDRFGGIDMVVANAGIMESQMVLDMSDVDGNGHLRQSQDADRVIDVNIKGTLNSMLPLRLALFYMKQPSETSSSSFTKSIVLIGSTSSYFGGTGVAAYVASKHGVLGLLRASQATARELGVRVNAIAPFLTPTHITAGFAQKWLEQGLDENTPDRVAEAIALVALDRERQGNCLLVAGQYLRELELSRTQLLSTWIGEDVAQFMGRAMQFFVAIGGYVLPNKY
ncbi:hypothetical protein N7462_005354 [Penicillium macrosclerotiorum]|uniref:uncharacterized protein n=1 Tax=Penicillium macrosclerotiorum TaxID=303699 RepID=UPI002546F901|nr:uncharacterized protein N7462_005354 [Penicillium macrosclerotiorum]KAJ5682189.1 hypothetical protein N7462_005354 [Penicillium macrosclerotiorum]